MRRLEVIPVMAKFVVVACEPVALLKVKFWRVEEPVARMFAKLETPVKVGALERTKFPVPVSSLNQLASCEEFVKKVEVATPSAPAVMVRD